MKTSTQLNFDDTKQFHQLQLLRQEALKRYQKQIASQRLVKRWPNWYILRILIWKNLTIRCRRKMGFFLLLFQILLWFGIACFTLSSRNTRIVYIQEPSPKPTQLVPRIHPNDLELPIGVSFESTDDIPLEPLNVHHADSLNSKVVLLSAQRLMEEILYLVTEYYSATYHEFKPKFRLFANKTDLIRHMRFDPRILHGIHFNSFMMNGLDRAINYSLIFLDKDIPSHDAVFNGYDCRETLNTSLLPENDQCAMSLYGKYGFLLAQTALDTAVIQLISHGPFLYRDRFFPNILNEKSQHNDSNLPHDSSLPLHRETPFNVTSHLFQPTKYRLELPGISVVAERFPEHYATRSHASEHATSVPFYFVIALISLFSFVLVDLVAEKETQVKNIMLTYGVSKPILWISWFITHAIENLVLTSLTVFLCSVSGLFGRHTSIFVITLIFYTYLLSLMTFGSMFSVFFHNTNIASVASTVLNLFLYFLGRTVHQARISSFFLRSIFMLFSTVSFSVAIIDMINLLPDNGVVLSDLFHLNASDHSVGICVLFLIFDIFLYLGMTIFLDVYGEAIQRCVLFIWLSLKYRLTKLRSVVFDAKPDTLRRLFSGNQSAYSDDKDFIIEYEEGSSLLLDSLSQSLSLSESFIESVPKEIQSRGVLARVRNLTKRYPKKALDQNTDDSHPMTTVVDHISFDLYPGEVFALLGHNGAGKTTSISMLTGQLPMDDGDIYINNFSLRNEFGKAKKFISVCPQKNIFFEDLMCLEHIIFFAALRGIDVTEGLKMLKQGSAYFKNIMRARSLLKEKRRLISTMLYQMKGKTTEAQRCAIVDTEKYFHQFNLSLFLDEHQLKNPDGVAEQHDSSEFVTLSWNAVLSLIEKVELSERMFFTPKTLSGGMRRRLWLAIALIGNPKLIFLDEPTSGVDPMARQDIWSIIEHEKANGRCIVITTHHMEEADLLADRKGIMVSGKLCCLGTSLFLKSRFGIGYRLELILQKSQKTSYAYIWNKISSFIKFYVPEATPCFDHVMAANATNYTSYMEMSSSRAVCLFSLPVSCVKLFPALFRALEREKTDLGIDEYGIGLTALEDVFFRFDQNHSEISYSSHRLITSLETQELHTDQPSTKQQEFLNVNARSVASQNNEKDSHFPPTSLVPFNSADDEYRRGAEQTVVSNLDTSQQLSVPPQISHGSYGDLVSQKCSISKSGNAWDYLGAITLLRWLQIIHNKTVFFIDVLLPIVVILFSLFFRENGPGELQTLYKQGNLNPIPMHVYTSKLNSPLPFSIDPRLSEDMVNKVHDILAALPSTIKPLLFQVDDEDDAFRISKTAQEASTLSMSLPSSNTREEDTKLILRRTPLYSITHLPYDQAIEKTFYNGRILRNFFFVSSKNQKPSGSTHQYQAGLSFELRTPNVLEPNNDSTWGDQSGLQVRIFYNPQVAHLLPILLSLLSNTILHYNVFKLKENNSSLSIFPDEIQNKIPKIDANKSEATTHSKKLLLSEAFSPSLKIYTEGIAIHTESPEFVTPLTYGMYVMLSVGLSVLPARFGVQMMLEKARGTKHMMIIMGLPFKYYWFGSFSVCYLAMVFGNLLACLCIAYFIPLFWSFASFPVFICTFFHSASVLLYSFFLSQFFHTVKAYTMVLQLSSAFLCLVPAYFVSVFSDASISDQHWYSLTLITHIFSSFAFPPYNPIGVLIGCAVVIANFCEKGYMPTFSDYFALNRLPIWNVFGATAQAIFLYSATVHIDKRNYRSRKPTQDQKHLLEYYYNRKKNVRELYLAEAKGNQLLIPDNLQDHKDEQVIQEEIRCQAVCERLTEQENLLYEMSKTEKDKENLSLHFQKTALYYSETPGVLPLVLMNDIHYLFLPSATYKFPVIPVQGVSLSIYRGEILGLLGPNGAGKTTCLNLLTCHYTTPAPTRGQAFLGGHNICSNPSLAFSHLGFCPQTDALLTDLTIRDNLEVFARIKLVPKNAIKETIDTYIEDLALHEHQYKRVEECSGGNKRRASVAVAFIGDPDIVLLDEPSSGIDPVGRRRLATLIRNKARSCCVLVTTHSMGEAESLCTKIAILVNGELNCINTPLALRNRYGFGIRLEVLFDENHPQYKFLHSVDSTESEWKAFLEKNVASNIIELHHVANHITYSLPLRCDSLGNLFELFETHKTRLGLKEFAISQPTLEQVFISFAKRQKSAYERSQIIFQR